MKFRKLQEGKIYYDQMRFTLRSPKVGWTLVIPEMKFIIYKQYKKENHVTTWEEKNIDRIGHPFPIKNNYYLQMREQGVLSSWKTHACENCIANLILNSEWWESDKEHSALS